MSNRNSEKHFANVPSLHMKRSTFPMEQEHKTTFNVGDIVPFFTYPDILPGDTFKIHLSFVMRLQTPINPTMDNLYADIYWFYDRHRFCWTHFREFVGETGGSAWFSETEYTIPTWYNSSETSGSHAYGLKTAWDYMGLRCIKVGPLSDKTNYPDTVPVSALPLRTYYRIYNRFFRDQNLIAPITENMGDSATSLDTSNNYSGKLCKASRFSDYFSRSLPGPQRGAPIQIGLPAQSASVSIYGNGKALGLTDGTTNAGLIQHANTSGGLTTSTAAYGHNAGQSDTTSDAQIIGKKEIGITTDATKSGIIGTADLSNLVGATVDALRLSIQTQKILVRDALNGVRFPEIINAHFGVSAYMQDYPEYIGGTRVPINITAVANTTGTNDAPQGYLGAFSHTIDSSYMATKSFDEWGTLMGLVVVRAEHSYSQNIPRSFTRQNRLDLYWPELSRLGEQPVYNYELFLDDTSSSGDGKNNEVFGYQERWGEYRYLPNIISSEMRPDYAYSLSIWHYGDDYSSRPGLSQAWLEEPTTYVARTLTVKNQDQILADFNTSIVATRCMPTWSFPEYMDHF